MTFLSLSLTCKKNSQHLNILILKRFLILLNKFDYEYYLYLVSFMLLFFSFITPYILFNLLFTILFKKKKKFSTKFDLLLKTISALFKIIIIFMWRGFFFFFLRNKITYYSARLWINARRQMSWEVTLWDIWECRCYSYTCVPTTKSKCLAGF